MSSRIRSYRRTLASVLAMSLLLAATLLPGNVFAASITAVSNNATGATTLANAMLADPSTLSAASFVSVTDGTPNGVSDALSFFPTNGSTFGIMTTGDVGLADHANSSGSSGVDNNGGNIRGNTDYDVSILKLDLTVPETANCLMFDFAFYSEEFKEYVGLDVNDAFVAELDTSDWTTTSNSVVAHNFAFDSNGDVVSINSTGASLMSAANAAGTTYDGASPLLQAATPVTAGAHSLYLSIFDQGDGIYDSAEFIDNIRMITVADVQKDCVKGAVPVGNPTPTPDESPTPTPNGTPEASPTPTPNGTPEGSPTPTPTPPANPPPGPNPPVAPAPTPTPTPARPNARPNAGSDAEPDARAGWAGGRVTGTPTGKVLPATDTMSSKTPPAPADESWRLALLALAGILATAVILTPSESVIRHRRR